MAVGLLALLVASLPLVSATGTAAAGGPVSLEAESGDVAGSARVADDGNASGGSYVEFGRSGPEPGITVSGNRLLRNGNPWVPRGFTLVGALSPDNSGSAGTANAHLTDAEMVVAKSWGADAVRFQVSQRGFDPQDSLYNAAYLDRVRAAVALARGHGLAVILSVQDQGLGGGTRHPQPSAATLRDWQTITSMFNGDHDLMYEMFNEPQNTDDAAGWAVWRDGGPADGNQGTPAVGHQAVLDAIRATGATNVVLADGARYAQSLAGVPLLDDPLGQVAYAVHPYLDYVNRYPQSWEQNFGYLAATKPVVATEWNVHSFSNQCKPDWPTNAPLLLDFLASHEIGMFGWALDLINTLVVDWAWNPTTLTGFRCGTTGKGAGELLQQRYRAAGVVPPGCPVLPANEGEVSATVSVTDAGAYRLWVRLRAPDAAHDTLWAQVDGGCPVLMGDGEAVPGSWTWVGNAVPLQVTLTAGQHTVRLIGNDEALDADLALLISDGCVPTGLGDSCSTTESTEGSTSTSTEISTSTSTDPSTSTSTSTSTTSPSTTTTTTAPPVVRQFGAAADARVEQSRAGSNFGTSSTLRVDGGSRSAIWSYLRFNVSGLTGTVRKATLRLWVTDASNDGPAAYATSNQWAESSGGITWNNRPARSGSVLDDKGRVSSGAWVEFDVTRAVTGDGTFSFVLTPTSNDALQAPSREGTASQRPQLVVTAG